MDDNSHAGEARAAPQAAAWRKSRRSNPSGNCVELTALPARRVAVRNSRYPAGPVLVCTRGEFAALVRAAKDGHFDVLLAASAANAHRDGTCTENSLSRA
jgi:hypothetical protein